MGALLFLKIKEGDLKLSISKEISLGDKFPTNYQIQKK